MSRDGDKETLPNRLFRVQNVPVYGACGQPSSRTEKPFNRRVSAQADTGPKATQRRTLVRRLGMACRSKRILSRRPERLIIDIRAVSGQYGSIGKGAKPRPIPGRRVDGAVNAAERIARCGREKTEGDGEIERRIAQMHVSPI